MLKYKRYTNCALLQQYFFRVFFPIFAQFIEGVYKNDLLQAENQKNVSLKTIQYTLIFFTKLCLWKTKYVTNGTGTGRQRNV